MITITPLVATAAYMAGKQSITPEEAHAQTPIVKLPPAGISEGDEPEVVLFLSPTVVAATQRTLVIAPIHYEADVDDGHTMPRGTLDECYPMQTSLAQITPADDSSVAAFAEEFAAASFEYDSDDYVVTVTRADSSTFQVSLADLIDDPTAARVVRLTNNGWSLLAFMFAEIVAPSSQEG